jgi:type IV secretory pathway TraG/TraD family ATPase VirD4
MPVCLSLEDLSMHLFVPGASGTGKTSSIIRPTIKQWLDLEAGGMLVLDGKGQLADELNGAAGYTVLSPESCDYNAIEGLLPEEVADTFFTLFANKGDGKDSVFDNNARSAIYYAGVLLHETEEPYTLTNIDRLLTDEEERRAIASKALEAGSKTAINAVDYWVREYAGYSDRIQSSILVTCKAWLSPVLQNRYLTRWNECTTGERIESVLQGAKFGLSLPDAKYGKAGAVMSMLAIRRLYQAAKLRGDQWRKQPGQTQVLFVADEVQNLASANDIEFIPIARSLGVTALWATQNIDGLERLGKDKMEQLLGNFSNILAFPSRTKKSDEWLSNRAGKVWRTVVERFNGFPDSRFSVDSITHSGTAKKTHSTPNEPYIRRNISFGRTGHIAGSEDQAIFNNIAHSSIKNLFGTPVADEPAIKEPYADVQIMPTKIVDEAEIDSLLAKRGTVLAIFRRAGVVRRDVIKTQHLQNFGGQL